MSLFGTLVKKGIEINSLLSSDHIDSETEQVNQLKSLLKTAQNTAFGKYYGFGELLKADNVVEAFKKTVPIFDYNTLHEHWWHRQQELPDITWPGKPNFFALSSGTTGKSSKRIPITDDFLKSMRQVGTSLIKDLPNFDFPEELFESEILMLSSSANLSKHEYGHKEGEISGINVSNFPGWYDIFYRPGQEIAAINDWDERINRIANEAPNWNIGAIAGIPSWVLLMLQEVIKQNGAKKIHDIWPNLRVYASGGVAFETYREDFNALCKQPLTIIDTYLASEGFFSYSAFPGKMDMKLALSHGYFYEFIPFDERGVTTEGELKENPVSHHISEVETDQDYVLVISTCAGAWRYVIGDTIKFTNLDPHEILITGRMKFFLNVVGSQLSEEKLDAALLEVCNEMGVSVNEYSVGAVKNDDGEYIHQWIIVCDENIDTKQFEHGLDNALQEANKNYAVARNKSLKGIKVEVITKDQYYNYLESGKKKGGQVKTPKVMGEEKMKRYLEFLKS